MTIDIPAWVRAVFRHQWEPNRMVCAKCGITKLEAVRWQVRRCLPGGLPLMALALGFTLGRMVG